MILNKIIPYFTFCLIFILISCSPKVTDNSATDYTDIPAVYKQLEQDMTKAYGLLLNEINNSARIDAVLTENGIEKTIMVNRNKIDSLNIEDHKLVIKHLSSAAPEFPLSKEFLFINYYPGKDDCNSTGTATRNNLGRQHQTFNSEIIRKENVAQLNLFFDDDGLERWDSNRSWQADENKVIYNQFFQMKIPCFSHIIIHKTGKYYRYFGPSDLETQMMELDLFRISVTNGDI